MPLLRPLPVPLPPLALRAFFDEAGLEAVAADLALRFFLAGVPSSSAVATQQHHHTPVTLSHGSYSCSHGGSQPRTFAVVCPVHVPAAEFRVVHLRGQSLRAAFEVQSLSLEHRLHFIVQDVRTPLILWQVPLLDDLPETLCSLETSGC